MKKLFVLLTLSLLSASIFAQQGPFGSKITFTSKHENNITKFHLVELGNGQFRFTEDRNTCSKKDETSPWICTKIAPITEVVELSLISDNSVVDGLTKYSINDRYILAFAPRSRTFSICEKGFADHRFTEDDVIVVLSNCKEVSVKAILTPLK